VELAPLLGLFNKPG